MRRDLGFLKVSDYSQPFRLMRGHDDELNLIEDEINLESQILWKFYERYRSLPVGNGARSFEKA